MVAPAVAVVAYPVEECAFESDVVACFFRFDPLVFKNFFTLRQELLVETGALNKFLASGLCALVVHGHHVVTFFAWLIRSDNRQYHNRVT